MLFSTIFYFISRTFLINNILCESTVKLLGKVCLMDFFKKKLIINLLVKRFKFTTSFFNHQINLLILSHNIFLLSKILFSRI